jgi:hypothetical protein
MTNDCVMETALHDHLPEYDCECFSLRFNCVQGFQVYTPDCSKHLMIKVFREVKNITTSAEKFLGITGRTKLHFVRLSTDAENESFINL